MTPVIFRLARRYISRRLLQSALFVVGVALGVAVVIAIDLANSSASRAFALSTASVTGKATHQIIGGSGGLPTDTYRDLRLQLGLRDSAPVIEDFVRSDDLGNRPLRLLGVDPFAEPPFRDYLSTVEMVGEGVSGGGDALSAFIAEPGTLLMSSTLADRFNIEPGDTISIRPDVEPVTVRVVGVLQPADDTSAEALDDLLLADISTAQSLIGEPGTITRVDLILPDNYDLTQIEALLPSSARLQATREDNNTLEQMTAAFELNLQALSLLALVVGAFLIYNTVTFNVVQRRPVIGILRSLGATRQQIFTLILSEALLMGIIGTVLGMGLGIILGRGAVNIVSQTISDLYFTVNVRSVTVSPFTLLKGAAVGIAASVGSSIVPSIDATRTSPAGTMRRSDVEQQAQRLVPILTVSAIALNVVGLVLLSLPTTSIVVAFAALFGIVVGSAFFTPLAIVALMRVATPLTDRLFGVLGRMAPRAVTRSLSRTSVAVAALTVAVSVIVGVSVMISSFRISVGDWLGTTLGADLYIAPPTVTATRNSVDVDPAITDEMEQIDGVQRVETGRNVQLTAPDYPDMLPVNVVAASGIVDNGTRRFEWSEGEPEDYWQALEEGMIIVSEPFAFRRGITPQNNTLTLLTDEGEHTFTIYGVFYDYTTEQGTVHMYSGVYRQFYDDPYISSIAVFVEPDADMDAIRNTLETETLVGTDLNVQSNAELRQGVFEVFDQAFSITVALRLLATVVAFIGILSALLALQLENTRQYGVMRAVGMTGRQLTGFTMIQTGLMGVVAGLLALPIGLALALVLIYVINVRSFGWTMPLTLVPGEFGQAFMVALVAALIAGIYPAYRLSQLVTARALRSE